MVKFVLQRVKVSAPDHSIPCLQSRGQGVKWGDLAKYFQGINVDTSKPRASMACLLPHLASNACLGDEHTCHVFSVSVVDVLV